MSMREGPGVIRVPSLGVRVLPDGMALLFPLVIELEHQPDGTVCSTIEGLEGSLVGMGVDEESALGSAEILFQQRVDYAIENHCDLKKAAGTFYQAHISHEVFPGRTAHHTVEHQDSRQMYEDDWGAVRPSHDLVSA